MKISCNVIKDILPLYVEDLASQESREIVEDHINTCDNCKMELQEMKSSIIRPIDTDTRPLEKIRRKMKRKKLQTIIFSTMITLVIAIVVIMFLTAPEYLNDYTTVSVVENPDGNVVVSFDEEVSGFDIERRGYSYVITTWDSIWSRNVSRNEINSVLLNPEGENVESLYYFHTDGSLDTLLHGKNQFQNGGSLTLPRLALAYYLLMAMGVVAICGLVLIVFRKNLRVRNILIKIIFLPISYIIGHILIKGFTTSSYSLLRDFLAIILLMIGIYAAILLGINIYNKPKKTSH